MAQNPTGAQYVHAEQTPGAQYTLNAAQRMVQVVHPGLGGSMTPGGAPVSKFSTSPPDGFLAHPMFPGLVQNGNGATFCLQPVSVPYQVSGKAQMGQAVQPLVESMNPPVAQRVHADQMTGGQNIMSPPTSYRVPQAANLVQVNGNEQPRIPQSYSQQNICAVVSPNKTPRPTPNNLNGNPASCSLTPGTAVTTGCQTEPRNYAPRTSGQPITEQPPPKFDLSVVAYQPKAILQDPFVGSDAPSLAVQAPTHVHTPVQAPPPQMAELPGTVVQYRPSCSDKLHRLTATASCLPTFSAAMDPTNFPFLEGARQHKAINYGVIKIRNVSLSCSLTIASNLISMHRYLSQQSAQRLLLSWDVTHSSLMIRTSPFTSSCVVSLPKPWTAMSSSPLLTTQ